MTTVFTATEQVEIDWLVEHGRSRNAAERMIHEGRRSDGDVGLLGEVVAIDSNIDQNGPANSIYGNQSWSVRLRGVGDPLVFRVAYSQLMRVECRVYRPFTGSR